MTPVTPRATTTWSGRRVLLALLGLLVLAVVGGIVIPTLACRQPAPQLDDLGPVPAFAFVDERGQAFTQDALRGHPTIVAFIFTRCDTICPVTSMRMQRVQDETFQKGHKIKLLSISVDPTHDTPPVLAAYAKRYQADPERWRFVTGPTEAVQTVVKAFANTMQRDGDRPSGAPNIVHNGYFALVDGDGHLRGYYDSADVPRLEQLMRDARYLLRTQAEH